MFSNNNYLPDLNHYPPVRYVLRVPPSHLPPEVTPTVQAGSTYSRSGNFRFLSPTQNTSVPQAVWTPAACVMAVASAPGTGTSWQHAVPSTMPWANNIAPHFTALTNQPTCLPVYTMSTGVQPMTTTTQMTPKPSVGSMHLKRRLRTSSQDEPDGPVSKRYLSEKMARLFEKLQIAAVAEETENGGPAFSHASSRTGRARDNGWKHFHEVEKRLEEDLEVEELVEALGVNKRSTHTRLYDSGSKLVMNGEVLTLSHEVKQEVQKCNPVLPPEIVKTISSPCMELVVWKPPDSILTGNISQSSQSSTPVTTTPTCLSTPTTPSAASITGRSSQQTPAAFSFLNGFSNSSVADVVTPLLSFAMPDVEMDALMEDDMDV